MAAAALARRCVGRPTAFLDVDMDVEWRAVTRDRKNIRMHVRQRWNVEVDVDAGTCACAASSWNP